MRVECAWCKNRLGEKCPNCGSVELRDGQDRIVCLDCGFYFPKDEGGVSSGICRRCKEKFETPNLPGRLTEGDIVDRATRRGSR
jgi:ribosomal protein S27AE